MDASKSLSCENNNSSLFSAVPDSSIMYLSVLFFGTGNMCLL